MYQVQIADAKPVHPDTLLQEIFKRFAKITGYAWEPWHIRYVTKPVVNMVDLFQDKVFNHIEQHLIFYLSGC